MKRGVVLISVDECQDRPGQGTILVDKIWEFGVDFREVAIESASGKCYPYSFVSMC